MSEKKGGDDDGAWMLLLVAVFIALICWVIWIVFKYQLIQFVLWVRYAELSAIGLVMGMDHEIPVPGFNEPMPIDRWREFLITADPRQITLDHVSVTTWMSMHILKYVFALGCTLMMLWAVFRGPTSLYRRIFNLDTLIGEQSKVFRTLSPLVNFNPGDLPFRAPGSPVPAELPLFTEALSPEEWIAYNRLPTPDGEIDEEATEKAFIKQLGPRWKGALKQPHYVQILLASFCLKALRKRDQADDMLGRLASCWDYQKGLRLSQDRTLLKDARKVLKDKKSEKFHKMVNKHAFTTTAVIKALDYARSEGGVMAPAQFVWLRGHNRALWYPLNNYGRQAYHMEALGALSHYRAEKQVDRPIPRPRVKDAVKAIKDYLDDPLLRKPIPQVDYSMVKDKKKNQGVLKPASS